MDSTTIIFILLFLLFFCFMFFNITSEKFIAIAAHAAISHPAPTYTCLKNGKTISGCCDSDESENYFSSCMSVPGCPKAKLTGCNSSGSPYSTKCFAGSELILLENGQYKKISDISIGDMILTADKNYNLSFSPIIFLPHEKNNIEAQFIKITSDKNNTIKLTPEHNIIANNKVIYASKVNIGDILQTVNGPEIVKDISIVTDFGIYTAITENEFIIVNNIIASPTAYVSHEEGMEFYRLLKDIRNENINASNNIHNIAHKLFNYIYLL